jgi:hypothetical protein
MRSSAKASAKRKRVGRPRAPQRRPVLAARVPQDFYERIRLSAVLNGRNISEELIWRAQRSFELDADYERRQKLLQDAAKMTGEGKLQELGWTKVYSVHGTAWFEPGAKATEWIHTAKTTDFVPVPESRFEGVDTLTLNRGTLEDMLNQAAALAVEEMVKKMKEIKS